MVKIDEIIDDFVMIDSPTNMKTNNHSLKLIDNKLYSYNEIIAEKHNNEYKIYLKKAPHNFYSMTTSKHVNKLLNKCNNLRTLHTYDDYIILEKN